MTSQVSLRPGDICALPFDDGAFDVVTAEAVTMFVDRRRPADELARVCAHGGQVLATEFCWRTFPDQFRTCSRREKHSPAIVNSQNSASGQAASLAG
jgi:ubiquinone/menaquinone biosynthesis C-methylase UbiE